MGAGVNAVAFGSSRRLHDTLMQMAAVSRARRVLRQMADAADANFPAWS